jgi:hypothetical protein
MNEISRNLMTQIDKYVEEHTSALGQENTAKIAQPEIERLAAENGIDSVDLLVDYLDHVALVSKRMNMNSDEKMVSEEELLKDDFKLY